MTPRAIWLCYPISNGIGLQSGGFSVISSVPNGQAGVKVEPCKRIMALRSWITAAMDLPVSLPRSGPLRRGFDWFIVCRHSTPMPAARHTQWWDCGWGCPHDSCQWLSLGALIGDSRPNMDSHWKKKVTICRSKPQNDDHWSRSVIVEEPIHMLCQFSSIRLVFFISSC